MVDRKENERIQGLEIRNYKFRIRPNAAQSAALTDMLRDFCGLYNACLQQRIEAKRRRGISLRFAQQCAELRAVREAEPDLARWSFTALQQVLRRVDQTFAAFFKRGHGFPRFRAGSRYHAATFRVGDGLTLKKGRRIGLVGVPGGIKAVWHRAIPAGARLGTAILTRQQGKWYIVFSVEADFADACGTGAVGVDGVRPGAIKAARERGGWWKSCSGCHETNEGHSTGWYAYSKIFGCEVGAGCDECGGLGVAWEYYTDQDYERMAEEARIPAPRPSQEEQGDA